MTNCPKCFARHCRCELTDGERHQLAALASVKPKKQREGRSKGKKVAGIFNRVVSHTIRAGSGVSKGNY